MIGEVRQLKIEPREIGPQETETTVVCRIVRIPPEVPSDPTPEQRMRIVEVSGTLDFWDRPEEDVYTLADGEPV